MCVFVGVRIGSLNLFPSLLLRLQLLLLRFARCFLPLLPSKLFRLEEALLFLCLFQNSISLCIQLLLFEFLLGCSSRLSAEILHFLLLVCHFNLSFLLFNDSLHLRLLHETYFRH